jgi:hypothetical protein
VLSLTGNALFEQPYLELYLPFPLRIHFHHCEHLQEAACFCWNHTLKESDLKNVEKAKLKGHHIAIEEFYPYCGKKGLDFLLSKVMLYFLTVAVGLDWNWEQTFDQLPRVLKPTPRKAWEEVCHKHPDL